MSSLNQDVLSAEREVGSDAIEGIVAGAPHAEDGPIAETPLPKLQLFILLYIQLAEPITSTVIYPFVNQQVRKTGITGSDEDRTGYFAGLIESSFYATEALCVLQWGRASDRLGRKPIMMSGLLGLTLSMLGFGLAKQYWALVLARCAEGALNGNIGVTKSMMAEITDESNRDKGFAFMPMIWSLGSTLGPAIGGIFSTPASRWPHAFQAEFWKSYPYFLPCVIAACISVSGFLLALCGLREVRPISRIVESESGDAMQDQSTGIPLEQIFPAPVIPTSFTAEKVEPKAEVTTSAQPVESDAPEPAPEATPVTIRSILTPQVVYPIMNYGFLAFTDQSIVVLLPLMYSTPIGEGGLGFNPLNIGLIQGITGVVGGLVQIFTFPWFRRRFGNKRLYIASYAWYLFCVCAFPLLAFLAKRAGRADGSTWAVIVLQNAAYAATNMTWGCIFMYISEAAPNQQALGLTNGLAQTTASVVRAMAPSVASSLFSVSQQTDAAGGTLVYWLLCAVIVGGLCASMLLPKRL
ncbi:MFS general substrate transporter [Daedalea quercina L-15889]|uniref:MFS general substrate transporter n=1 Tax=Daedalea quercina L-15889 TaxID=1314783 RepID=A0A165TJR7_9APHY|nr:MFS general substrate transporter [Daedalea quercina L-15889]